MARHPSHLPRALIILIIFPSSQISRTAYCIDIDNHLVTCLSFVLAEKGKRNLEGNKTVGRKGDPRAPSFQHTWDFFLWPQYRQLRNVIVSE